MRAVSPQETVDHFEEQHNDCTIRYGDLKKQLAEDIITFIQPIRERIEDLWNDDTLLKKIVDEGAEKGRESASKTISEVREIIGIKIVFPAL